jgi:hypothetical protein
MKETTWYDYKNHTKLHTVTITLRHFASALAHHPTGWRSRHSGGVLVTQFLGVVSGASLKSILKALAFNFEYSCKGEAVIRHV